MREIETFKIFLLFLNRKFAVCSTQREEVERIRKTLVTYKAI